MDHWTIGWLLWILWFAIEEGAALFGPRNGRTLSEHVWAWASIGPKKKLWRLRRFLLLAGLAWLAAHLLSGGAF